ncbi:hypothetical protein BN1047_04002 [Mycolicibacterium neoaurum]|uniref:Uncharacterized protein n=1 Tax=Mycolicibacterium neoaurum TaxID=1795 RepID=A0AAV2WQ03_MYCNE|nr:hypothetical protein BN1047_04002 [Mycolicibacterium neoaurum]
MGVIDEQQPYPGPFGGQQIGIDGEGIKRRAHQLGCAQCGHGGLRRGHPDSRAQQHHLFVGRGEPSGSNPFGPTGEPAQPLQCKRVHPTFGAARQQVPQFGGETGGSQRGMQLHWPVPRTVFEFPGEQLADDAVLFGAGDEARRGATGALGGEPQHREGIGVHGAHQWFTDHPTYPGGQQRGGDGGACRGAELGRTGQQQNRFRIGAGGDVRDRGVDEQAALAGTRATEDAHHAAPAGLGQRLRGELGVRCGHDCITARGSDKWL